jgi:transcriptional regulator with XRE-family HTH domain
VSVINRKMSPRQREIGARLKAFREGIKYSQASFAEILGLTRDQLASVEYGRTPLKYSVAWQIRFAFGLSLDWLWGGEMSPDDLTEDRHLPHPDSSRAGKNALLTDVFNDVHQLSGVEPRTVKGRKVRIEAPELAHRWLVVLALRHQIDSWIASIPDGHTNDFAEKLAQFADDHLKSLPADPPELIQARFDGLLWEKMRADLARKVPEMPFLKNKPPNDDACVKKVKTLTYKDSPEPAWPRLLDRLNRATQAHGSKVELAAWLGVHRQMVTDWLSDKQRPGGEIALQLLQWVERQEGS